MVSSLLSPRSQRLGDLVAGTMVLRERSATQRADGGVVQPAGRASRPTPRNLDVSGVTDAQFGVIRSFLLRVHELTPEARVAMAYRLATPVADAMHHRAPPGRAPGAVPRRAWPPPTSAATRRPSAPPAWRRPPPPARHPPPATPAASTAAAPAARLRLRPRRRRRRLRRRRRRPTERGRRLDSPPHRRRGLD